MPLSLQQGFSTRYVAHAVATEPGEPRDGAVLTAGIHELPLNLMGSALVEALLPSKARDWRWVERAVRTADLHDHVLHLRDRESLLTDADPDLFRWAAYALTHRRPLVAATPHAHVTLTARGARIVVALVVATPAHLEEVTGRLLPASSRPRPQVA